MQLTCALPEDASRALQALASQQEVGKEHETAGREGSPGNPEDVFQHLPRELRITIDEPDGPHTFAGHEARPSCAAGAALLLRTQGKGLPPAAWGPGAALMPDGGRAAGSRGA